VEVEARVFHPRGHPVRLAVRLSGDQAPYWRVDSFEPYGSAEALESVLREITAEELAYRLSVAVTLAAMWDSVRASSDRWREHENDRDE
jgi:hypothetical protein